MPTSIYDITKKTVMLAAVVSPHLFQRVTNAARDSDMNRSEWIRQALQEKLDRMDAGRRGKARANQ